MDGILEAAEVDIELSIGIRVDIRLNGIIDSPLSVDLLGSVLVSVEKIRGVAEDGLNGTSDE